MLHLPVILVRKRCDLRIYPRFFTACWIALDLCQFVFGPAWTLFGPQETVEMVKAVTGWDVTLDELMKVGERRLNMMRVFNAA